MGEPNSGGVEKKDESSGYTESLIDQVVEGSFPASDPPAWTLGTELRERPHRQAEDAGEHGEQGREEARPGTGTGHAGAVTAARPEPAPAAPERHEPVIGRGPLVFYQAWTRKALYERARTLEIQGRSRMSKAELIKAIRRLLPEPEG